jgi:twitching motility protein PilU
MTKANSQFDFKGETAKQEELQKKVTNFNAPPVVLDAKGEAVAINPTLDYIHKLLAVMVSKKGSDMFITAGFPPAMKLNGSIEPLTDKMLTPEHTQAFVRAVMNDKQWKEFNEKSECNFAIAPGDFGRFRVNAFKQQGRVGMILRVINTTIPQLASLGVPEGLKKIIMEKRGLVIVVGATGSGKSTTLAAMIGHRNQTQPGHIITIEDPIEFVHTHNKSIITQREVGVDTEDWEAALKNTLRQAPDVILIGEVRDKHTMEYAIAFAETGHLCLCTLHANNSNQALDRIINFFPEERRNQLLMDLSLNLKSIVSQRLIPSPGKGRVPAVEILINTPFISDLIFKGEVGTIREAMKKGREQGMQTFDQALYDLYEQNLITFEDAIRNADSANDLRLTIKLNSNRGLPDDGGSFKALKVLE